jgi:hypothetical protein
MCRARVRLSAEDLGTKRRSGGGGASEWRMRTCAFAKEAGAHQQGDLVGSPCERGAGYLPVPVSGTFCGLFAALSVRVRFAVLVPVAVGLKVTKIEQLAPAGIDAEHLLAGMKSDGSVPVVLTVFSVSVVVPVLVSVMVCCGLEVPTVCALKVKLVGDRVTAPDAIVPVPESGTFCGLFAALSVNVRDAVLVPLAVGLKVTKMEQLVPAGIDAEHLLAGMKSDGSVPVVLTVSNVSVALPEFVSVTVC